MMEVNNRKCVLISFMLACARVVPHAPSRFPQLPDFVSTLNCLATNPITFNFQGLFSI